MRISDWSSDVCSSDLETDGLLNTVTRVHCAVAIDIDTDEILDFKPDEIGEFLKLYQDAALLIGHNIIGYDCAVIEKLYGLSIPPADKLIDTVNLAKMVFSTHNNRQGVAYGKRV